MIEVQNVRDQSALFVFHLSLVEGQKTAGYNVPRMHNYSNLKMNCALLWSPAINKPDCCHFVFSYNF